MAGERDPAQLAEHRDYRCRASKGEIIAALTGNYRPEHLFVLQQNLDLLDACHIQLAACDSRHRGPRADPDRAAAQPHDSAARSTRDQEALGAFYRRLAARIGKPQAITATARKLAILVYRALKGNVAYRDPGADAYDLQQRTRIFRRLRQRAATLGFELISRGTGEILPAGLS